MGVHNTVESGLSIECITVTAANNFQLTFIQPKCLVVTNFGLAHRFISGHTHLVCYPVCQHPIPETNTKHHAKLQTMH